MQAGAWFMRGFICASDGWLSAERDERIIIVGFESSFELALNHLGGLNQTKILEIWTQLSAYLRQDNVGD